MQLVGTKRHRLTVLEERKNKLFVQCDCGNTKEIFRSNYLNWYTQSCGCFQKERQITANTTHGMTDTKIYNVYKAMIARCYNTNVERYPQYGGKGIRVCDEWRTFEGFYNDFGYLWEEGLSIDRIDFNGNYEPSNVRWIPKTENVRES